MHIYIYIYIMHYNIICNIIYHYSIIIIYPVLDRKGALAQYITYILTVIQTIIQYNIMYYCLTL